MSDKFIILAIVLGISIVLAQPGLTLLAAALTLYWGLK